jgi:hypothetical protein
MHTSLSQYVFFTKVFTFSSAPPVNITLKKVYCFPLYAIIQDYTHSATESIVQYTETNTFARTVDLKGKSDVHTVLPGNST